MTRPLRIEFSGALYHITARGNARKDIFFDDDDRQKFLETLSVTIDRNQWLCHAYCQMSNHYHLLIETPVPTLSRGMRYLNGVYSQAINRKKRNVGHFFQGRYKAILVEKESYLLELSRYIVLNPVRAGMVRSVRDWPWSSYRAMTGQVARPDWLTTDWVLGSFGNKRDLAIQSYKAFVSEGRKRASPWEDLKNQIYLGSEQFVEEMQSQLEPEQSLDNIPKVQKSSVKKPLSYYEERGESRKDFMALAYASGSYTLKEIGDYFGVSHVTVSRAFKSYESKM